MILEQLQQHAAACYGFDPSVMQHLKQGNINNVYEFNHAGRVYVLRVTQESAEMDVKSGHAIAAWVAYLAQHGAAVAAPLAMLNGAYVDELVIDNQSYILSAFEKAAGVLAETVPLETWGADLYRSLGHAVGQMHALAESYTPAAPALKRPAWDEVGNCFNAFLSGLDASQAQVCARYTDVLTHLNTLPKDPQGYGMIHTDLHGANFFIDQERQSVTIFDFDDCAYGWYMMDIAMGLFDALVLYDRADRVDFARRFLTHYLAGYREARVLPEFWVEQLPYFLKLVEIGVYAMVQGAYVPGESDAWSEAFMQGDERRQRIERDEPYIALDFSGDLFRAER